MLGAAQFAFVGVAAGGIGPCTVGSPWVGVSGAGPIVTVANQTITVPTGNSGRLRLVKAADSAATEEYRINSGAYTSFADGAIITLTSGQTLNFRITATALGNTSTITVIDVDTGATVGFATMEDNS